MPNSNDKKTPETNSTHSNLRNKAFLIDPNDGGSWELPIKYKFRWQTKAKSKSKPNIKNDIAKPVTKLLHTNL